MSTPENSDSDLSIDADIPRWYVMRDLKRPNALRPAWVELGDRGFDVFTPTVEKLFVSGGRQTRRRVAFISDLLFVRSTRAALDPEVAHCPTLQYRFVRGAHMCPMTVPEIDMSRFIAGVRASEKPRYLTPAELTQQHIGRRIRICTPGPMFGLEGRLVSIRGSRPRHILLTIPGIAALLRLTSPDYLLLDE